MSDRDVIIDMLNEAKIPFEQGTFQPHQIGYEEFEVGTTWMVVDENHKQPHPDDYGHAVLGFSRHGKLIGMWAGE